MDIGKLLTKYQKVFQIPIALFEECHILNNFDKKNPCPETGFKMIQKMELPHPCPAAFIGNADLNFYCGMIHLKESGRSVVLGPVSDHAVPDALLREEFVSVFGDAARTTPFVNWYRSLPLVSGKRFIEILDLLNYMMNEDSAPVINFNASSQIETIDPLIFDLGAEHETASQTEKLILSYITHGKAKELRTFWNQYQQTDIRPLTSSRNPNRAFQDIFLTTCSLSSRAAMQGGADFHVANSMADRFIAQYKTLNQADAILRLINQVFLSFAELAEKAQKLPVSTPTVKAVSRFVTSHLYEKFTTRDIAEQLNISIEFLCRHFKKNTGLTISYFVNQEKIKESKLLLETTGMSLSEISTMLGFSSQAYFQTVFKQQTGMTPLNYRENL